MPAMFADAAEVIFEVDWDSAPLSTAGVWTDESAYVRVNPSIATRRGRQSELEEFSYGTMRVELDNRTRRFDPSYSAGALFGKLLPRKRCRLRLKWSGTTYDVFTGWLTGFPQNYGEGRTDSTVTIEAVDSLAVLAEMGMSLDTAREAVSAYGLVADHSYVSDGVIVDSTGSTTAYPLNAPSLGPPLRPGGSASFNVGGVNNTVWATTFAGFKTTPTNHTLSMWIQWAPGEDTATEFVINCGTGVHIFRMDISGQSIVVQGGSRPSATMGRSIRDGRPHHMVWTSQDRSGGTLGKLRCYIDGEFLAQFDTSFSDFPSSGDNMGWGGAFAFGIPSPGTVRYDIAISDLVLFINTMSDAQVAALYRAYVGQIIEPTTTRATRYLDNVSWPAAWRDLAPTTGLGAARGECADVQQSGYAHNALNALAATEQGRYFAKKNGDVAFYGRYYAFEVTRGNTVQATFSDDGNDIRYSATGIDWSDREVNNDITVNWSNEPAKRSTDSTSITAYTRQSKTITTVLSTGAAATDMAAGLVGWRKDLRSRTRGIVVDARGNSAHWATLLGLEIGDRIRHEITPMGVGSQDVRDLTLEAIEWEISGDRYIVTLYGSPIPTDVFVLDSSLLDTGRLGF